MTERWHAQHRRNAEELYAAAVELQGPILKGAQWLGSRPDLLPRSIRCAAGPCAARSYAVMRRGRTRLVGR
jgi:predicted unusual protein kinase regulating ubiquinone biosynthesis (AarF/ABC1/UbiB family)